MRIAIDGRELEGRPTGVGRYLKEVLRAWSANPDTGDHEITLYTTGTIDTTAYSGLRLTSTVVPGRGVWWEQVTLPRVLARDRPDVLLAPGYTAPLLTSVPTVLVVHDVSFAAHPEWFSWREGARRRTITRLAASRAALVVTDSWFSKTEIEAHLGVSGSRVAVIPIGVSRVDMGTAPALAPAVQTSFDTVLYVGSIFNRRHVPVLIDAVALLAARGRALRLDIIGDNRTSPPIDLDGHARSLAMADRVRVRSYVSDEELAASYHAAGVFAFLSEYEGFGLTPLEALSAGVPSVVLDHPTAREVYGTAALFVPRPDAGLVADAIETALFNHGERARILAAAPDLLARYSWTRTADHLLAALALAAQRR